MCRLFCLLKEILVVIPLRRSTRAMIFLSTNACRNQSVSHLRRVIKSGASHRTGGKKIASLQSLVFPSKRVMMRAFHFASNTRWNFGLSRFLCEQKCGKNLLFKNLRFMIHLEMRCLDHHTLKPRAQSAKGGKAVAVVLLHPVPINEALTKCFIGLQ